MMMMTTMKNTMLLSPLAYRFVVGVIAPALLLLPLFSPFIIRLMIIIFLMMNMLIVMLILVLMMMMKNMMMIIFLPLPIYDQTHNNFCNNDYDLLIMAIASHHYHRWIIIIIIVILIPLSLSLSSQWC